MNCLFETTTKYTLDEFKRFNWALSKKARRVRVIIYGLLILALLLEALLFRLAFPAIAAGVMAMFWLAVILLNGRAVKKVFESNKVMKDAEIAFEFYDTFFVEKMENGETRIAYDQLDRILETPTNIYLLIAKNQGYILNKANFPEGLEEFIRSLPVKH